MDSADGPFWGPKRPEIDPESTRNRPKSTKHGAETRPGDPRIPPGSHVGRRSAQKRRKSSQKVAKVGESRPPGPPKRHPKSIEKSIKFERAVRRRSGSARRAFWSAFAPILGRSGGPFSTFFALFSESGEVENSMYFTYYRRGRTSENPSKSGRKSRWKTGPAKRCPFDVALAPRSLPRAPKREPKDVENEFKNSSKKRLKKRQNIFKQMQFC